MKELLRKFQDYLRYYEDLSENSIKAYLSDLSLFLKAIKKRPQDIKKADIRKYIDFYYTNPSTIARKLIAIKKFFTFLKKESIVNFSLPKKKVNLPKFIKPEFVKKIIDKIGSQRDRLVILILAYTGLRVSEVVRIKIEDIDFVEGYLRVITKGAKERLIPLPYKLIIEIEEFIKERRCGFLFGKKKPPTRQTLFKLTKKYLGVSPHVLRHSLATGFLSKGADLRLIQEILGHKNLNTTTIYTHIIKPQLKKIHNIFHPRSLSEN